MTDSNTPTPRRVVVGIDGSASSRNALAWASSLALATGGEVDAVHVWNYPIALVAPTFGAPVATLPADFLAESAAVRLDAVVDATTVADDLTIGRDAIMGSARTVLTQRSSQADLIVLGRTGHRRATRALIGSTASHCVRHSECPVVVVGDSVAPETTITVAVDGSDSSIGALVWALGLGDKHDIVAVYSHDEWELDELPLDAEVRRRLDSAADDLLQETIAAAVETAGGGADRIKRQVRQGDPRTTIVDQGDPGELLVLGGQGRSGLARWALGSLADYAVHHAPGTLVIWR